MQVFEASKRAGFFKSRSGLAISTVLEGRVTIESEIRLIKEALFKWQQRRGKRCGELMLVITADESQHVDVMKYVEWAMDADVFMSEFAATLEVEIQMLNPQGRLCKQLKLGPAMPETGS